jgi:hypothetical protein
LKNTYNTILFPADVGGCGWYRMKFNAMTLQTLSKEIRVIDSMKLMLDPNFYKNIRMVRLQRQVSDAQAKFFLDFLKPLSKIYGFWTIYEIDDVIDYRDIPIYNIARTSFTGKNFNDNIKNMLLAADFVTVTTEALKEYYSNKFNVNPEKFIVIPNYLPRWWAGESYNIQQIQRNFVKHRKRPRIGFTASSSHFDIEGKNNYVDDFTHIVDMIKRTYKKYKYVFIGGFPFQLKELVKSGEIEFHKGSDLLNYPRELYAKELQAIIAPLRKNVFNECKSNIKLIEGWALGIPVFAQNIKTYNQYTDLTFENGDDLEKKLNNLLTNQEKFMKTVKKYRNIIDYGDKNEKNGWWLEKNIQKWYDLFTMPQRKLTVRINKTIDENENKDAIKLNLGD